MHPRRFCTSKPGLDGAVVCALLVTASLLAPTQVWAQNEPAGDDPILLINRAITVYNQAELTGNPDERAALYGQSVALLTKTIDLDGDDDDLTARFLRAIVHGELAVLAESRARGPKGNLQALRQEMREGTRPGAELIAEAEAQLRQADAFDRSAREHYGHMRQDIESILEVSVQRGDTFIRLLDGVVAIKLADYAGTADLDEQVAGLGGDKLSDDRLAQLQAERSRLLAQARQTLRTYLDGRPGGLLQVQAEFFHAVVAYRQAFDPSPVPGRADVPRREEGVLDDAERLMLPLTEPARIENALPADTPDRERLVREWLSYPTLYLGLIRTVQGRFNDARALYGRAVELDVVDGQSQSNLIPILVERQLEQIERAESMPAAGEPIEDVLIELTTGIAFDSNVMLLGTDTSTPRDIGRKADFRFGTRAAFRYSLDLGKVDEQLDRWRFGVLGRVSSNWHADIFDFNEQDYGASVAIDYRLIERSDDSEHGPLYAGIQFDYDYFLLGNDGFLSANKVTPNLTLYTFDQRLITSLAVSYEDRNYLEPLFDTRFNRDGNYFLVSLNQAFELMDMAAYYEERGVEPWGQSGDPSADDYDYARPIAANIGMEYSWDSTRGTEFDTGRYSLVGGLSVPLPYGITFDVMGRWDWEDYQNRSLVDYHRRGREDFIQRYRFGLERRFVLNPGSADNLSTLKFGRVVMILRGDVQYTNDDSNVEDRLGQEIFQYDRAIYGFSVSLQFN
jgi:hypothetical protein